MKSEKLKPVLYAGTVKRYPLASVQEVPSGPNNKYMILLHGREIVAAFDHRPGYISVSVNATLTPSETRRIQEVLYKYFCPYFQSMRDPVHWVKDLEYQKRALTVCGECGCYMFKYDSNVAVKDCQYMRLCRECLTAGGYQYCQECGDYHIDTHEVRVVNRYGTIETLYMCDRCEGERFIGHLTCEECGVYIKPEYAYRQGEDKVVCEHCCSYVERCDECGGLYNAIDITDAGGRGLCPSCYVRYTERNNPITGGESEELFYMNDHVFSYHGAPDFDRRFYCSKGYTLEPLDLAGPYMGMEYELDGIDFEQNDIFVDGVLSMASGLGHFETDSSLNDGVEWVQEPCTLAYIKKSDTFRRIVSLAGGYMDISSSDGIHINVGRAYFGDIANQKKAIGILAHWLWRFKDDFFKLSGREDIDGSYYGPHFFKIYADTSQCEIEERLDMYNDHDRYHNLNIQKRYTIEFRLFASSLFRQDIIVYFEVIDTICRKAKAYTIARAAAVDSFSELISRKDFM